MLKFSLFIVFTVLTTVGTILLLPRLVVLGPLGYVAGFFINLLSSAVIILPSPGFAAVMVMATQLNPFLLGLVVGIGGTLGELVAYWLGAQGHQPLQGNRIYGYLARAMTRAGGAILFLFGLMPFLPVDAAGVLAGAAKYPIAKFLFYLGLGKTLMTIAILYLAARAYEWAEPYLMWLT
jgi:membrane protein YqaA with SNARE-associated domain